MLGNKLLLVSFFSLFSINSFSCSFIPVKSVFKVKRFLKKYPQNNKTDCLSEALMYSLRENKNKVSVYLIEIGADVNYYSRHNFEFNPIFSAILNENLEGLKLLVDKGADLSINYKEVSQSYETALYVASIHQSSPEIVEYLLTQKVDPNQKVFSCRKSSVLYEIAANPRIGYPGVRVYSDDQIQIVKSLLKYGADINHRTVDCGFTDSRRLIDVAKIYASRGGDKRLLNLLIDFGAVE